MFAMTISHFSIIWPFEALSLLFTVFKVGDARFIIRHTVIIHRLASPSFAFNIY